MAPFNEQIKKYFEKIDNEILHTYGAANKARALGYDPETKVDIPIARNMAERVEGLISAVAPQLVGKGVIERIQELEKKYGSLSWEVALIIAAEVAKEKFCKFSSIKEAMEVGIRTGFTYQTAGIVAAPLEGFVELRIKKRKDGKEYIAASYAGPIRGAGGTAAAFSTIIADYVRKEMGYEKYDPDENEINRFVTEVRDYHERITNLQYFPSDDEVRFMVQHLPIEIDGDPTEKIEVSNYKDLPRIETNRIRGGVCLVIAEGLTQKAQKLWKQLSMWQKDFDIDWSFLSEFIELQKKKKAKQSTTDDSKEKIKPNYTYLADLVAGRPVLAYPLRSGGFRLRYGRSRTSGYSTLCIHPATMYFLNNYIAIGTQLKVERPGKATALTTCDTIEGPIVKLNDDSVHIVNDEETAKRLASEVKEIIYLGDFLASYGDFFDRNHSLVPVGYCEEWWIKELEKATVNMFGMLDETKLANLTNINQEIISSLFANPLIINPTAEQAINISEKMNIPLHPKYTFHWKDINKEQFMKILELMENARIEITNYLPTKIILPYKEDAKRALELIGLPHFLSTESIIIEKDYATAFAASIGLNKENSLKELFDLTRGENELNVLEILNKVSSIIIKDKSGTFVGARMGRPEKAKMRKLIGSPHTLFPVGEEGGRLKCFQSAIEAGKIKSEFAIFYCENCKKDTIFSVCENCSAITTKKYFCKVCGIQDGKKCPKHGENTRYIKKDIDIKKYFDLYLKKLNITNHPELIKGVKGTSNKDHLPENLAKGILRSMHDIYVNKDGTTRYDMTELPITHFKPKEIGTPIEKLKELGYENDINGNPIENNEQIIELLPQDVILPSSAESFDENADEILFRVSKFVDDLLVKFYGLDSFYNFEKKEDLIGHLIISLAPHISAGMVARIIGFSKTQGFLAHPLMHAAMRRDCDGDEACAILLMDALLNFSRQFLPDQRGGRTMDAPLVLTTLINPAEVDDMVHKLDIAWSYPLELYEAAMEYKMPSEIKIDQLGKFLGNEKQYSGMGFTHDTSDINSGVKCSAYKTLPSMEEKLKGQMEISERIRAVEASDVATLVIEKHFLKDIKGNLRKFSTQKFRCSKCNEKFRRPPLMGKCTKCGGNIIFTISEGSVLKYLEPSISLANKYQLPNYLKQSLDLLQRRIDGLFGKETETQTGLGKWFG